MKMVLSWVLQKKDGYYLHTWFWQLSYCCGKHITIKFYPITNMSNIHFFATMARYQITKHMT